MSDYIMYHKDNCSVSLQTLKLLKENGIKPGIRLYLENPPTQKELADLVKKLGIKPFDLVRTKERLYKDNYEGKKITSRQWLKILSENPILMERPILIKGDKAVLGRPPEKVLELKGE